MVVIADGDQLSGCIWYRNATHVLMMDGLSSHGYSPDSHGVIHTLRHKMRRDGLYMSLMMTIDNKGSGINAS